MKRSRILVLAVGFGAGYLLGTRAGREQYERLVAATNRVWQSPRVAKARADVEAYAREQAPVIAERAKAAPGAIADQARKAGSSAKDAAGRTSDAARDAAAKATTAAKRAAGSTTVKAKDIAGRTSVVVTDAAVEAVDKASEPV